MVSGGAAGRRGRPTPDHIQKAGGRSARSPAGPGVGEGGRRASPVTCARRGPRPLPRCARACRPPGAAVAAAARRRGRPGPGGRAAGSPRRGARLPGGGLGAGPRSHFVLCKSHESGFPRAGAAMLAAEGRARAPLCSAERAAAVSVSSPRAPGGAVCRPPRPCPRRASLPRSLPGWLPRSLARSLALSPPPRPGALESAEFAEREPFKFSALGCLERGL